MECLNIASYRSKPIASSSESDSSDNEDSDVWKRCKQPPKNEIVAVNDAPNNFPKSSAAPVINNMLPSERRKKVNNIWSSVLQEQLVSDDLGHCGLEKKPENMYDRSCENYDFTRKRLDPRIEVDMDSSEYPEEQVSDKDIPAAKVNKKRPLLKSKHHKKFRKAMMYGRDIKVDLDKADSQIAEKIVRTLGEKKWYLIHRAVRELGAEKSLELLKMTEDVEEQGGMLIKNNARRRTPGGVYIQLLKADKSVTQEQMDKIFEDEDDFWPRKKFKKKKSKESQNNEVEDVNMDEEENQKKVEVSENNICESEQIATPEIPVVTCNADSEVEEGEIQD